MNVKPAERHYNSFVADSARWEGFEFRSDDIIISTPAKCGTTWTQMICGLLIFQTPAFHRPLAEITPWLDMLTRDRDEVFADLAEAVKYAHEHKDEKPMSAAIYGGVEGGLTDEADEFIRTVMTDMLDKHQGLPRP